MLLLGEVLGMLCHAARWGLFQQLLQRHQARMALCNQLAQSRGRCQRLLAAYKNNPGVGLHLQQAQHDL